MAESYRDILAWQKAIDVATFESVFAQAAEADRILNGLITNVEKQIVSPKS